jgi:hypothetical protein
MDVLVVGGKCSEVNTALRMDRDRGINAFRFDGVGGGSSKGYEFFKAFEACKFHFIKKGK